MPSAGLSLVGFLGQADAIEHLKMACVPSDESDGALLQHWAAAREQLGSPIPNSGHPQIQTLPEDLAAQAEAIKRQPWVAAMLPEIARASVRLVEIDPLLSFQLTIDIAHADGPFRDAPAGTSPSDLLPICLPADQPPETFVASRVETDSQAVILKSRALDLQMKEVGLFEFNINGLMVHIAGAKFYRGLQLVHVVRYNGKCYLYNGFHRAVGARRRGAAYIPCIFRDLSSPDEIVARAESTKLRLPLLESTNPPTVGHFTQGRAYAVQLRRRSRVIHVSWSQYIMADE
jgi:hypothetical protein